MGNKDEIIFEGRSKTYAVPISQSGRRGIIMRKKGCRKDYTEDTQYPI